MPDPCFGREPKPPLFNGCSTKGLDMDDSNSPAYYQSRERRERELAAAAVNPAIAEIHLEMARRYSELIQQIAGSIPIAR